MKRQIKFRGKEITSGEWLYGSHYNDGAEDYILENLPNSALDFEERQIDQNTIGQFTGLQDCKGNDIYEGDIIFAEFADKSGGYQLVGWNGEAASWGIMDAYSYQSLKDGYDFAEFKNYVLLAFFKKAIIFEVVGNIHDNPELLKGGKK